jgi:type IV pilus assembly protein PilA
MKNNQSGFSLVELLVVVIIIAIIAAIAIPNLLASRRAANEASAISTLRTIHSAQATYNASQNGASYSDGNDLTGLVDTTLNTATFTKSGYDFAMVAQTDTSTYCMTAIADVQGSTGTRSFAVGIDGSIKFWADGSAACNANGTVNGGSPL